MWQGKNSAGEKVLCATGLVLAKENPSLCMGGIRIVVSLEGVSHQFRTILYAVIAVVLIFFLVIVFSGFYFIRSIVSPIQGISERARQIALGDFSSRIEVASKRKDEITDLCETINQMAGELASTEQMKNEFISSVSHELRTPLTAIKGWGETVMGSMDDPELTKKGMEVIIGEAERLSVIVEDLLDFSRMQNGKLTYHMKPCDVVAEMGEAILSLAATASDQKVLLDFTEPADIPVVIGDAGRLQQVFVNVVGNALKYTPEGGSIVVDIKTHENEIEILVSDTGCGIDAQDLEYIKQKFYKGKDAVRGSGIGLAIADEIVTAHGGRLEISSTLRVGTTVTIFLPTEHATGGLL
jgi:signal transduction histidine kinase